MPFFRSHPSLTQVLTGIKQYLTAGEGTPETVATRCIAFMAAEPAHSEKLELATLIGQAQYFTDLLQRCDELQALQKSEPLPEIHIKAQEILSLLQRCATWLPPTISDIQIQLEKASREWQNPMSLLAFKEIIQQLVAQLNLGKAADWQGRYTTLGQKIRNGIQPSDTKTFWQILLLRHPMAPELGTSLAPLDTQYADWKSNLVTWQQAWQQQCMPATLSYHHDTIHFLLSDSVNPYRSHFAAVVQEQKWRLSFAHFFLNRSAHYPDDDANKYARALPTLIKESMELASACTGWKSIPSTVLTQSLLDLALCRIFRQPSQGYMVVLAQQGNCGLLARNPENNAIQIIANPALDYGAIPLTSISPKVRCYHIPEGHEILLLNGDAWRTLSKDQHVRAPKGKGTLTLDIKALQSDLQTLPAQFTQPSTSALALDKPARAEDLHHLTLKKLIEQRYYLRPGFHESLKYAHVIKPLLDRYKAAVQSLPDLLDKLAAESDVSNERLLRAYLQEIGLADGYWPDFLSVLVKDFDHLPHPLKSFPVIETVRISSRYEQVLRNFFSASEAEQANYLPIIGQLPPPLIAKLMQSTGPYDPKLIAVKLPRLFNYWNEQAKTKASSSARWSTVGNILLWSLLFIIPGIWKAWNYKSIYKAYYDKRYMELTAGWRIEIGNDETLNNVRTIKRRFRPVRDQEWRAASEPTSVPESSDNVILQALSPAPSSLAPKEKSLLNALGLPKTIIVEEHLESALPDVRTPTKVAYCLMPGKTQFWQAAKLAAQTTPNPQPANLHLAANNDINLLDEMITAEFPRVTINKIKQ